MNVYPQQKDSLLKMYVLSHSKCTNETVYCVLQKPKPTYLTLIAETISQRFYSIDIHNNGKPLGI